MTASCRVCGRQVEVSDSGQEMPCICIVRPLDAFIADCVADCIEGRTYSFGDVSAYAAGVRDDAAAVQAGRSADVDGRRVCRDCGRSARCLEDGRCSSCNKGE